MERLLIISNHVSRIGMTFPKDAIIRINTAWVNSKAELSDILADARKTGHKVFLDYPSGRVKPPAPVLSIKEVISLAESNEDIIRFFAFSNAESRDFIQLVRQAVPSKIMLVPKIETSLGIINFDEIIESAQTRVIMLDKEDLYVNVGSDVQTFNQLVDDVKEQCQLAGVTCLELKGVVFSHD
jgi:pyruvate kinase